MTDWPTTQTALIWFSCSLTKKKASEKRYLFKHSTGRSSDLQKINTMTFSMLFDFSSSHINISLSCETRPSEETLTSWQRLIYASLILKCRPKEKNRTFRREQVLSVGPAMGRRAACTLWTVSHWLHSAAFHATGPSSASTTALFSPPPSFHLSSLARF